MTFKIGYSTYALKRMDPFSAVKMIKDCGYEYLEICLSESWPTSPISFNNNEQDSLRNFVLDLGFPSPVFFGNIDVCASKQERPSMIELTKKKFEMAHRLHYDETPVIITTTPGHSSPSWNEGKNQIRDSFLRLADLAAQNDLIIAIEAHAGTDFETPEKAVWLMNETRHPNLKLDMDISHFVVEGNEMVHSVDICAPYASMVHIKDGDKTDDNVRFCLPGEGNINVETFLRTLRKNKLENIPVFAEVSLQISSQVSYEPRAVADFCFKSLDDARNTLK